MKHFIILLALFFCPTNFAAFLANTLVKTEHVYRHISELKLHDAVACIRADRAYDFQIITHKTTELTENYITIVLDQDTIVMTPDQRLYLPIAHEFKAADQLKVGDLLLTYSGAHMPIRNIFFSDNLSLAKTELFYDITVDQWHNFFVSRSEVLVHNMPQVVIELAWTFGAEAIKFAGASICAVVCGFFSVKLGKKSKGDDNSKCWDLGAEVNEFKQVNEAAEQAPEKPVSEAQAPGKPTENDGYVSPKRWNGKKVKHPKTGQHGYPDKNGKVWVPTGPGPGAHGGTHWDVVSPDGKRYDNVYPGGKVRKGR